MTARARRAPYREAVHLLRRPLARDVLVVDALIAALLLAVGQLDVWVHLQANVSYEGGRAVNAALVAATAALVVFRRRAPLAAAVGSVLVVCLSRPFFAHDSSVLEGFVPLIVLTAGVAAYDTRRRAITALVVAEVGLALFLRSDSRIGSVGAFLFDAAFIALPWLAVLLLHRRSEQARFLTADLDRVRREAEERERAILADERARIARELHDVVAHSVSVMVVNVGAARMHLDQDSSRSREPLLRAEEAGRQALTELRRLLGVLREAAPVDEAIPAAAPQPTLRDLDRLAAQWRASGVDVRVMSSGDVHDVSPALELSAYRIVQEAITNAVKHGEATQVDVSLRHSSDTLDLVVTDNGTATSGLGLPASGHGLIGIRERVALFGGQVEAGPKSGGGWRLVAHLPLPTSSRAAVVVEKSVS